MTFSINNSEFAAPMGVKLRDQKDRDHHGDEDDVVHATMLPRKAATGS
jgi:hypothetical protein